MIDRYLYDKNLLRDVKFEEDPMTISNEYCKFVMDMAVGRVRDRIKIPCKVYEDQQFIQHLEDTGLEVYIYERIGNMTAALKLMREVGMKINNKCNGLQEQEQQQQNFHY